MDYDIPPTTIIESTEQRPSAKGYAIPYDEAPFESVIHPGETMALYGRIHLTNAEEEAVFARTHFELRKGFTLTVYNENMQLVLNEKVSMHQHYTLKKTDDAWVLALST
jgi:hypothetical protein